MGKSTFVVMARTCLDCGADISDRGASAKRCVDCQRNRANARSRAKWANDPEFRERQKALWRAKRSNNPEWCERERERNRERKRAKTKAERKTKYQGRTCVDCDVNIYARIISARIGANIVRCVDCQRKRNRKVSWAGLKAKLRDNPEYRKRRYSEAKAYHKSKRLNDPTFNERNNARLWQKRLNDPEWHKLEKERHAKYMRDKYRYDPIHRAKVKARSKKRIHKPWDSTVTAESVADLLERQRRCCTCCRGSIANAHHMDHVIPKAKGGASTLANLQLLCPGCNILKGDKLEYFPPQGGQGHLALGTA